MPPVSLQFRASLELATLALLTGGFFLFFPERSFYADVALGLFALLLLALNINFTKRVVWARFPPPTPAPHRFHQSLSRSFVLTGLLVLLLFGAGVYVGYTQYSWAHALERVMNPNVVIAICVYFPWALLQQTLFQFYLLGCLLVLFPAIAAITITGIAYALVHFPDWRITLATAAAGLYWTYRYYRYRALTPLALSHAVLGATFYYWIYHQDLIENWGTLFRD